MIKSQLGLWDPGAQVVTPQRSHLPWELQHGSIKRQIGLASVAQWVECWPVNQSYQFNSQSGYMSGLQARSWVGGEQEATYRDVSLTH